jgi:hypothetical protein
VSSKVALQRSSSYVILFWDAGVRTGGCDWCLLLACALPLKLTVTNQEEPYAPASGVPAEGFFRKIILSCYLGMQNGDTRL